MLKLLIVNVVLAEIYEAHRPVGFLWPSLYGSPTNYWNIIPLRHMLSMIGSVHHRFAKCLVNILKRYLRFHQFQKEFVNFVTLMRNCLLMCSFDISNHFACVAIKETFEICAEALYEIQKKEN